MEDRYQALMKVVKSHSLLQLGLSTFRRTSSIAPPATPFTVSPGGGGIQVPQQIYEVQTFNFWMMTEEEFAVTPSSIRFLAESGLDFNFLFSKGIRYSPKGTDKPPPTERQKKGHPNRKKGERDAADEKEVI